VFYRRVPDGEASPPSPDPEVVATGDEVGDSAAGSWGHGIGSGLGKGKC